MHLNFVFKELKIRFLFFLPNVPQQLSTNAPRMSVIAVCFHGDSGVVVAQYMYVNITFLLSLSRRRIEVNSRGQINRRKSSAE